MKTLRLTCILELLLIFVCAPYAGGYEDGHPDPSMGPRAEGEERPSASGDLGFLSKYIWRGFELSDDSIVVQPSATVRYRGFSMNIWGNLDLDFEDMDPATTDKKEWTETDLTLSYETEFGPFGISGGYIYYAMDGIDDSEELFLSLSLDVLLSPSLTVYREISHLPGWYVNLGISHSFELSNGWSLDLEAGGGYYYSDDEAFVEVDDLGNGTAEKYRNFHNGLVSATLNIPAGRYFTIAPMVAYSFPLSDQADNLLTAAGFSNDSDFIYGGVNFSISFP